MGIRACIINAGFDPMKKLKIYKYFINSDVGTTPDKLQVAPINVVEHAVCSTPEWWGSIALETMLCAGGDGIISGCHVRRTLS